MRTNIILDDELLRKAMNLSGVKTKRETVEIALTEYVMARSRLDLSELRGKVQFSEDYDYKSLREGR